MKKKNLFQLFLMYQIPYLILLACVFVLFQNISSISRSWALVLFLAVALAGQVIILRVMVYFLGTYFSVIKNCAAQVKNGEHECRMRISSISEFDDIRKAVNPMLDGLDNAIKHLGVHREELRLIVNTIEEILWAQGLDGKIEWVNEPFCQLFETYDPFQGQYYWEVIREPELTTSIKEFSTGLPQKLNEIEINGSYYLLSGSRNPKAGRLVFILQNIDAIRKAEQMKKDFIVNLAHELRTPLTAIKGFSEAMEQTAKIENIRYLKIIQNHTDRLIHLINDLQTLIKLERNATLSRQKINLPTFFDNIRMILMPMLEEKGLSLKLDLDENLPRFAVDPFKFEQVFINLMENALRYTETGGITVKVWFRDLNLNVEFCDTGSGILQEHLSRIFERFYVADPSRNKANGGAGLGLAIVKHIILLHQGKIEVKSTPGTGTCFTIQIPDLGL